MLYTGNDSGRLDIRHAIRLEDAGATLSLPRVGLSTALAVIYGLA
jgi:hypothetical protein